MTTFMSSSGVVFDALLKCCSRSFRHSLNFYTYYYYYKINFEQFFHTKV